MQRPAVTAQQRYKLIIGDCSGEEAAVKRMSGKCSFFVRRTGYSSHRTSSRAKTSRLFDQLLPLPAERPCELPLFELLDAMATGPDAPHARPFQFDSIAPHSEYGILKR